MMVVPRERLYPSPTNLTVNRRLTYTSAVFVAYFHEVELGFGSEGRYRFLKKGKPQWSE